MHVSASGHLKMHGAHLAAPARLVFQMGRMLLRRFWAVLLIGRVPLPIPQVPSMVTLMVEGGASPPAQQQNQQAKNREKPILVKTVSGPYEHGCAVLSANGGVAGQLSSRALSGALSGTPRPLSRVHGDHEDPGVSKALRSWLLVRCLVSTGPLPTLGRL